MFVVVFDDDVQRRDSGFIWVEDAEVDKRRAGSPENKAERRFMTVVRGHEVSWCWGTGQWAGFDAGK